jgi:hypothetical protein
MRCEEGYCCQVCGAEVAEITQSALYLRYVLGEVRLEELPHDRLGQRQHLRLPQYGLCGLLLLVWWVAVLAQHPLHQAP